MKKRTPEEWERLKRGFPGWTMKRLQAFVAEQDKKLEAVEAAEQADPLLRAFVAGWDAHEHYADDDRWTEAESDPHEAYRAWKKGATR